MCSSLHELRDASTLRAGWASWQRVIRGSYRENNGGSMERYVLVIYPVRLLCPRNIQLIFLLVEGWFSFYGRFETKNNKTRCVLLVMISKRG